MVAGDVPFFGAVFGLAFLLISKAADECRYSFLHTFSFAPCFCGSIVLVGSMGHSVNGVMQQLYAHQACKALQGAEGTIRRCHDNQ